MQKIGLCYKTNNLVRVDPNKQINNEKRIYEQFAEEKLSN